MSEKKKLSKKIHLYHEEIAEARAQIQPWILFKNNFIGGVGWGLGSVVGATLVVGLLSFIISIYGDIPILGKIITIVARITQEGLEKFPNN